MANLTHGSNWNQAITQDKQTATYNFLTGKKYVDADIQMQITAKSAVVNQVGDQVQISSGWIDQTTIDAPNYPDGNVMLF